MEILVLGGTAFVGLHIARALLKGGHSITIFNRGVTHDPLPSGVERLHGDRDAGPAYVRVLAGRTWDACIDVSGYTARQVRPSAEALRDSVGHFVYISAVSVYGDPQERPVTESNPRVVPAAEHVTVIDGETYGPLKVACENVVKSMYGDRCALLRPQVIVGPGDTWNRYTHWVQRARQGGDMLAPGDGTDHLQVIDVRDVAAFVRMVVERRLAGTYNLSGHRITWAEFMRILGADRLVWVPAAVLQAAGVMFPELPLFRPEFGPRAALMDVSCARALDAGLMLTDPVATAVDVRAWCEECEPTLAMTAEREAALLRAAQRERA
jgi:2'-hydroxyisoflavone reductase